MFKEGGKIHLSGSSVIFRPSSKQMILFPNLDFSSLFEVLFIGDPNLFYQGPQSKLIIRDPKLIMGDPTLFVGDPKFYQRPRLKLNIRNPTLFIGDPRFSLESRRKSMGFSKLLPGSNPHTDNRVL